MSFQIIGTLNNHLFNQQTMDAFIERGVTFLRINGSHVGVEEVKSYAERARALIGHKAKLLLDLPGNKIRTSVLSSPIVLQEGKTFDLYSHQLNHPPFLEFLKEGDVLFANDSQYKFQVVKTGKTCVQLLSYNDGKLTSNKGVHLFGTQPELPFLFERDLKLIEQAKASGIDYLGLSFVRTREDVEWAKRLVAGTAVKLLVKVETASAVENLDSILEAADEFLVDRGDLSCDIGLPNIDQFQKYILHKGHAKGKRVYFATQFFFSMLEKQTPLISEVSAFRDAVYHGVDGIQLSEETAIGKNPVQILDMVQTILKSARPKLIGGDRGAPVLWLTGPSGAGKSTVARAAIDLLKKKGVDRIAFVDGDEFREFWNNDTGYTKEDRFRNLRNIIFTAAQARSCFDLVIVASLSPYRQIRDLAREKISNFHEVFVSCPQEVCAERDPKGHYKRAKAGEIKNFVGVTEEYEAPLSPELVINTAQLSLKQAADALMAYVLVDGTNAHT